MPEEKQKDELPKLEYDWNKLELAQVAQEYLKQGEQGMPYAKKSLELVLEDIGIKDSWLVNTVTDPQVVQKTIENQLQFYAQYKQKQTISDLVDYHSKTLNDYLGKDVENAKKELEPFMDKKYLDLQKEMAKAKYLIKGKELGITSDEDVEKNKKVLEKYEKVDLAIKILEGKNMGKLRERVENATMKESMQSLFKKEESEELKKAA